MPVNGAGFSRAVLFCAGMSEKSFVPVEQPATTIG
jgi:hypothetical protein